MRILFLFVAAALGPGAAAQTGSFTVPAGQAPGEVLRVTDRYKYADFRNGTVRLRNGNTGSARLNWSYLDGGLQFIQGGGDTLLLVGNDQLDWVAIGADTFYLGETHWEQVASIPGKGRLVRRQFLRQEGSEAGSGIGEPPRRPGAATPVALKNLETDKNIYRLPLAEKTIFVPAVDVCLWPEGATAPVRSSRKTFERLFSDRKPTLAEYTRTRKMDYDDAQQVEALFRALAATYTH